jgi:two-component system, sensor histidine kinase and response regulator
MAQNLTHTGIGTADTEISRALDRALALSRVGEDLELLQEIAQLFLEDSARMLSEIRSAVQDRDAKKLDRSAHTLKGCVSNFGAEQLYEAALAMERMGRAGDLINLDGAFRSLEYEVQRLEADLRSLLTEGAPNMR